MKGRNSTVVSVRIPDNYYINLASYARGGRDVTDEETKQPKFDRKLTLKYAGRHRGSIRLSSGRYYTIEEWEKRKKKLKELSLP